MELVLVAIAAGAGWWIWRSRRRDKMMLLDFGVWRGWYDSPQSPAAKSQMAAAFLAQSLHFAVESGAVAAQNRGAIAKVLRNGGAQATLMSILGVGLPVLHRLAGEAEVERTPARAVGALLLLAWISPKGQGEEAVRKHLFRR